jgi:hypothetical protein
MTALVAGIALFAATAAAPPDPPVRLDQGFPVTSEAQIFELDDVRPGLRGTGYTVFRGPRPEPFGVRILGVMEDMLGPGEDVILARLEGERIEFTGVISGMSGSPVYVDGRLLGAVAYRFGSFAKEPIAGITPIRSMLQADQAAGLDGAPGRARRMTRPISSKGLSPEDLHGRNEAFIDLPARPSPGRDAEAIADPLSTSGVRGPALGVLRKRLAGVFGPISPGGGPLRSPGLSDNQSAEAGRVVAPPIAPGSPIAAVLMKGDMNVAAIGTVTFVDADRVIGFGHPFLGFGQVAFPMATAAILNTLASDAGSYKQGTPALEVGAIRNDRLTAIAGRLGSQVGTVQVEVWTRLDGGQPERVAVEIVDEPTYLPVMTEVVVASALTGRIDLEAGGTVDLLARIQVSDRTLEVRQRHAAPPPFPVAALAARDVAAVTGIIARNDLEEPRFDEIHVEVRARKDVKLLELMELSIPRRAVQPGEQIAGHAVLQDYRGRPVRMPFEVRVPAWARGTIRLVAAGGFELDRHLDRPLRPASLDDILGALADRRSNDRLYVAIVDGRTGVQRRGERYEAAPASLRTVLEATNDGVVQTFGNVLGPVQQVDSDAMIRGLSSRTLRVQP